MNFTFSKNRNYVLAVLCCISFNYITASNYYSDPTAIGKMTNSGTSENPWSSLSAIFAANKTFVAGDTIFLKSGNHGYAIIKGLNSDFVVIMPAPDQNPILERVRVGNGTSRTDYWKIANLTIQSESTLIGSETGIWLIDIYPQTTHVTISNCIICSSTNTANWTRDDWRTRCNSGITSRPGLNAFHIIENNEIRNTALGIQIGASNSIVRNNLVQNFTHDASRILGSEIVFEQNKLFDLIKVMAYNENHDDMFQAFTTATFNLGTDTLKNVTVKNNIFINTTDTTRSFRGSAQGIGCFNGPYDNWSVENNIIMIDHWHGIAMYGAHNCNIINNTVIDPYLYTPINPYDLNSSKTGPAWILIDSVSGMNCNGNFVRNNLVSGPVIIKFPLLAVASNNIIIGGNISNWASYFIDVSNTAMPISFNLQLKENSPAIDAGTSLNAPTKDFADVARPLEKGFDVGAYEFQNKISTIGNSISNLNNIKPLIKPTSNGFSIQLEKPSLIFVYTICGQLLERKMISNNYSCELKKGIYLVTINNQTTKFMKF